MVLYIFELAGTPYVKLGYTSACPRGRVRDGVWKLVHPTGCCGKLGWDDLRLLVMSPGSLEDEAHVKARVPPERGEFWPREHGGFACSHEGAGREQWQVQRRELGATLAAEAGIPCDWTRG